GVSLTSAMILGDYRDAGVTYAEVLGRMRDEITSELNRVFGRSNVDATGGKAIKVSGNEGTRSEVDVVPTFTLHHIRTAGLAGVTKDDGVALLSPTGHWTFNYPDQHIANGRAKRLRTGLKFKRIVRSIKRLQSDMEEHGLLRRRVPSFLIECLVYLVEDYHFLVETDDRYMRVKRVLQRISERLNSGLATYMLLEINDIKPLFGGQAWTLEQAQEFVRLALWHLGDD
ncbi:hypothetical protein ABUE31_22660, partial [Mesorhizobium sp. ZMM04-5]